MNPWLDRQTWSSYFQAVQDNFSRYILAWTVKKEYGAISTAALVQNAIKKAESLGVFTTPNMIVDGGAENNRREVNNLVAQGVIEKTIAQIEIDQWTAGKAEELQELAKIARKLRVEQSRALTCQACPC